MLKTLLFLLINISLISPAIGEQSYFGASIGDSKVSLDNYNSPIGYKAFVGLHINDQIAAEFGIINLGEFKNASLTSNVNGLELSAVGFIPVGEGSIFAKLGIFNWTIESSIGSISATTTGTDVCIGLGAQFPVKDTILFRVEYQEFREINDSRDDFTFLSIGFVLPF